MADPVFHEVTHRHIYSAAAIFLSVDAIIRRYRIAASVGWQRAKWRAVLLHVVLRSLCCQGLTNVVGCYYDADYVHAQSGGKARAYKSFAVLSMKSCAHRFEDYSDASKFEHAPV